MSEALVQLRTAPAVAGLWSRARPYVALTKPRIIELLLVTTVPAMFLAARGWPGGWLLLNTLVGGTLAAGAANTFNMVWDRDIDQLMGRTRSRPLPAELVTPARALVFGSALAVAGLAWLWVLVAPLPAALTGGGLVFYVAVYTALLKRRTVQNIVIGGAAGAVPALVGWAAVTGSLSPAAWVLFAVVFLWTPPHFWALAVVCERDYAAAAVPMLPVVAGRAETARRSLRYTAATVVASFALPLVDPAVGWLYLVAASCLGALFLGRAMGFRADPAPRSARPLFTYSITYLGALSLALVLDQVLPPSGA
jgi:heme o synthase